MPTRSAGDAPVAYAFETGNSLGIRHAPATEGPGHRLAGLTEVATFGLSPYASGKLGRDQTLRTARRILVVCVHYAPDFVGAPKYNTEFCALLAARGHDVEVVTGLPHYPAWLIPSTHRRAAWKLEWIDGVKVWRTPLYVPRNPSGLKRIIHSASFGLAATFLAGWRAIRFRPDIVFTVAPTLLSAPAALAGARVSGATTWMHVQDFEIDAAFELGLLKGKQSRRLALGSETWLLRQFDRVSTISRNMMQLLSSKGVPEDRIVELRNWVDVEAVKVWPSTATRYRVDLDIPPTAIVALYSGNMAGKQGLERLAEVATMLEAEMPELVFLLCGNGSFRAELETLCASLKNVRFLDLQPFELLPELLGTADIHLLPQRAEAADLVLPSKLTGILASGRPVVAMAQPGTSLADEVAGCGIAVEPDAESMAAGIRTLAMDPALRATLGQSSREAAERRWHVAAIIDNFELELERLMSAKGKA